MEYLTHEIEGVGELRFAHLTPYCIFGDPAKSDVNGFVPLHRRQRRRELIEDMTDTGMDKGQQLVELQAFRNEELGLHSFIDYLAHPTAPGEVVRYAWARANADKALPALTSEQTMDVLWALLKPLGIAPTPKASPAPSDGTSQTYGDGGGEPANPQIPPTYSATPSPTTAAESGNGLPSGH